MDVLLPTAVSIARRSACQKRSRPQLLKLPWSPDSRTVSNTSHPSMTCPPKAPVPMFMPARGTLHIVESITRIRKDANMEIGAD